MLLRAAFVQISRAQKALHKPWQSARPPFARPGRGLGRRGSGEDELCMQLSACSLLCSLGLASSEGARLEGEGLNTTGTQSLLSNLRSIFHRARKPGNTTDCAHKEKAHRPTSVPAPTLISFSA